MTGSAYQAARARMPLVVITLIAGLVASAAGLLAAASPPTGAAAAIAAVAIPIAVLRPTLIVHGLIVVVFLQAVTVHGVTLDRGVAPLAALAVVSHAITKPSRLPGARPMIAAVSAYGFFGVASFLWTLSPSGTVHQVFSLVIAVVFLAAFATLVIEARELRGVLRTLTVGGAGLGVWWLLSFALGIDRAHNPAGDPNFNAALLSMCVPIGLWFAAISERPLGRRCGYLAVLAMIAGCIATLSRGGAISLIAVMVVLVVSPSRALLRSARQRAIVVGAGVLIGVAALSSEAFVTRISDLMEGASRGSGRGDLWAAAWHGYVVHPFTGIGYGAFKALSQQFLSQTPGVALKAFIRFSRLEGQEVHSSFLGSLTELGPAGLALYVLLIAVVARTLTTVGRRARAAGARDLSSGAFALRLSLLAFVVSAAFISAETSARAFWMVAGLALAMCRMVRERERDHADLLLVRHL